jgi:hypothetical protein
MTKSDRIASDITDYVATLLHATVPIGRINKPYQRGLAWITPDQCIHTACIGPYCVTPLLIMRLHVDHYYTNDREWSALGLKEDGPVAKFLRRGGKKLEVSFHPDETYQFRKWMTTWVPRFHEAHVPIEYDMEPGNWKDGSEKSITTVGYIWTRMANEAYQKGIAEEKALKQSRRGYRPSEIRENKDGLFDDGITF